ncbi:hypothetical protein [Microcoleus anatoxicus]|uniref:Lipase domain-containing protein n=1 Tax=Microcoleus anatoxicus PTRS2 TaxID=2705321 RepID=A0ABU8YTE0_9CYAN
MAFGENWDAAAAKALAEEWFHGDFSDIPPVKIVSSAEIGGANGAFAAATDTIYVSRELLAGGNLGAVADVLLEEIGHSVDARLNVTDSPGDEGAIFSRVVQGKELTQGELQALKGKDDTENVVLSGENTTIEMSQQGWVLGSYTDWRNRNFDFQKPDQITDPSGNRRDSKDGIYINWGKGSPFDPANTDIVNELNYFATSGYTQANFEAGKTYKFRVSADDYIVMGAKQIGQSGFNWITPLNQDRTEPEWQRFSGGIFKEYTWTPAQSGSYKVQFWHYDITGDAGVDISWEKVNGSYSPSPDPNRRVDNDFVERNIGKTQGGNDRRIAFERVNSPGYIENRPTWVIIHGWNGKAGDLKDLGQAIERYDGYQIGDQVLTLDWDAARTGLEGLNAASSWITTVGEKAAETLNGWGINSSNINLVGHSLGTYVAAEIAKKIPGGVNKLIALDPAATTLGGYQEGQVNFSDNSKWSWAFYGSAAGNFDRAYTADESFKFEFPDGFGGLIPWKAEEEKHGAVVSAFADTIKQNQKEPGYFTSLLNLNKMNKDSSDTQPWKTGDGFEAWLAIDPNNSEWVISNSASRVRSEFGGALIAS